MKRILPETKKLFRCFSFFIRRLSRQEYGWDIVLIKIAAHESCVIYSYAESKAFHLINVRDIFQQ